MARRVPRDVILSFIQETQGYLPVIREGVLAFATDTGRTDAIEEAYRQTHTIKGSSSMVGLATLSQAAYLQEELLEQVTNKEVALSPEVVGLLFDSIDKIEAYLVDLLAGNVRDREFLTSMVKAYRRYRKQPESEDEEVIERLLAGLGEGSGVQVVEQAPVTPESSMRESPAARSSARPDPATAGGDSEALLQAIAARSLEMNHPVEAAAAVADIQRYLAELEPRLVGGPMTVGMLVSALRNSLDLVASGIAAPTEEWLGWLRESTVLIQRSIQESADPSIEMDLLEMAGKVSNVGVSTSSGSDSAGMAVLESLGQSLEALAAEPANPQALEAVAQSVEPLMAWPEPGADLAVKMAGLLAFYQATGQPVVPEVVDLLRTTLGVLSDQASGHPAESLAPRVEELQALFTIFEEETAAGLAPSPSESVPSKAAAKPAAPSSKPRPNLEGTGPIETKGSIDPELLEVFTEEANEHFEVLRQGLPILRDYPNDSERLREVRRSSHTLKGAAGAVGLMTVSGIAARMEDLIDFYADRAMPIASDAVDLLESAARAIEEMTAGDFQEAEMSRRVADLRAQFSLFKERAEGLPTAVPEFDEEALAPVGARADVRAESVELDAPEAIDPDLLAVFLEEAEDHLRSLHDGLATLQYQPGNREVLQDVRRAAHTLKGAAGAVGLRAITQVSHRMEDLLDHLYDGERDIRAGEVRLLQDSTDVLADLTTARYDRPAMLRRIEKIYTEFTQVLAGEVPVTAKPSVAAASASIPEVRVEEAVPEKPAAVAKVPAAAAYVSASAESADTTAADDVADAALKRAAQVVRVPIERLDELVRLVSELVINRTAFEQRMADFIRLVGDLRSSTDRTRNVATELVTEYEASTLGGGKLTQPTLGPTMFGLTAHAFSPGDFDELEMDRYTQFHLLTRSLAESTADINTVGHELSNLIGDFETLLTRQGRLSRDIQDRLMRARMVPLGTLSPRLQRAVRVVANQENKNVQLRIMGEHIELDKTVLEEMADPLLHLLRNSVDHGVEPPEMRSVRGKAEQAHIEVKAFYQGTQVVIQVSDDGGGLDPEKIRAAGVRGGFISSTDASNLSSEELWELILLPGFSTAPTISEVSGRGVGMDIVRAKVNKLKGTLTVESTPGLGTRFTIRLPMTLAIIRALLVKASTETFAIPIQAIAQIIRVERDKIETLGQDKILRLGGKVYPVQNLAESLGLAPAPEEASPLLPVLIANTGDRQVALLVDGLLSGREIVVKTLGSHLRRVRGLIGATVMGDGTLVPILNVSELVGTRRTESAARAAASTKSAARAGRQADAPLHVLIVDDSVSVRRVVSNLITGLGWVPLTAKDGLDALELLQRSSETPDLVLLDVEMPRMTGYELLATLRNQPDFKNLPVIMITSRAGEKHRRKAMDLGASEYVVKPYHEDDLLTIMRRLTNRQTAVGHP